MYSIYITFHIKTNKKDIVRLLDGTGVEKKALQIRDCDSEFLKAKVYS